MTAGQTLANLLLNRIVYEGYGDANHPGVGIHFFGVVTGPRVIKAILLRVHHQEQ
jgi:hypothetical protein